MIVEMWVLVDSCRRVVATRRVDADSRKKGRCWWAMVLWFRGHQRTARRGSEGHTVGLWRWGWQW